MYRVQLTPTASAMFSQLHPDIKKQIKSTLTTLNDTPYAGKSLQAKLADFRSLKMKRYRAVYQVNDKDRSVTIYAIGHRRKIYDIATALMPE